MNGYSEECLKTFLKNQGQLFDEPVAEDFVHRRFGNAALNHGDFFRSFPGNINGSEQTG